MHRVAIVVLFGARGCKVGHDRVRPGLIVPTLAVRVRGPVRLPVSRTEASERVDPVGVGGLAKRFCERIARRGSAVGGEAYTRGLPRVC